MRNRHHLVDILIDDISWFIDSEQYLTSNSLGDKYPI